MAFNLFKKKNTSDNEDKKVTKAQYFSMGVREVINETHDAITIVFDPPKDGLEYKPGQFLTLILPVEGQKLRRAYSLCTSPATDQFPAVTVKRVDGGKVSNYLNSNLKAGDRIEVMEPMGVFTPEPSEEKKRHLVLFAGGSGITPMMSIIKSVLINETKSKITLIYGNRDIKSIIFKNELEKLESASSERLKIIHVIENPPAGWEGMTGLLTPDSLKEVLTPIVADSAIESEYYMCGPEGLMSCVSKTLDIMSVPKEQVFKESFVAGTTSSADIKKNEAIDDASQTYEVTVIYAGEEYKFAVEPDKTILHTALSLDIDLPYSCQSGICTACRGKCLSGKVKLDENEGLSQKELSEGYVLTCVGHPLTPDVVIEIG
jgi:ring-1,2-phenylacetyl-CoA epoxidase subunit PaaE